MRREVDEYVALVRKIAKSGGEQWRTVKTVIHAMHNSTRRESKVEITPDLSFRSTMIGNTK